MIKYVDKVQGKMIKFLKIFTLKENEMYKKKNKQQLEFEDFYLPFGGKLRSDNRWIKLSKIIPWDEIEEYYSKNFSDSGLGAPAKSVRIALGSLLIKEKCGYTDEETVDQIIENPYLQYFIGLEEYQDEAPFDSSMMVYFRKRFNKKILMEINEKIALKGVNGKNESGKNKKNKDVKNNNDKNNSGKLIVDATCTPADIRFPTDISLLNEAREKTEMIIDKLYGKIKGKIKKPRTYRKKARKDFLKIAKRRRNSYKELRKGIGKQLRYAKRNLSYIDELKKIVSLGILKKKEYKDLLVISELYRQQKEMYDNRTHSTPNRIVSISQPHIRPIVRGKASARTEFGAKISLSVKDGYVFLDKLNWENYNESNDLINQIETYHKRFGCYPESIHADKIYRNRVNYQYCKEKNIRLSGIQLGRPKKEAKTKEVEKLEYEDMVYRIRIEGKIGVSKRGFSLNKVMAKLDTTSETVIGIVFLLMNLEKRLIDIFLYFLFQIICAKKECLNPLG
jgi:hypothetical protein